MKSEVHNKGEVSISTKTVLILSGSSPTELGTLFKLQLNGAVELIIIHHN